jgi:hypothetical protein
MWGEREEHMEVLYAWYVRQIEKLGFQAQIMKEGGNN